MKGLQNFLFIFMFSFTEQTTAQRDVCPPWFIPDNTSITGCSCHQDGAKVYCGPGFVSLHLGFCMTYNNNTGATEFGACPYIAHYNTAHFNGILFNQMPSNVSQLNEFMCGGYGIALYSYIVSAGDMVMDGSCTTSWNFSQ